MYVPTPDTDTAPAQLALKLQDGTSGAPWETQVEIIQPYGKRCKWQELVFDFSAQEWQRISQEYLFNSTEKQLRRSSGLH